MDQPKKVLVLIKGLGAGGAERLLTQGAPYFDRDRYEYEVAYFLPWKNALVPELRQAGIPVHCLGQHRPYDPRGFARLVRLLRERRPDVLHMHLPYAALMGRLATRFVNVPAILYTEHNLMERYHPLMGFAHRRTYRWNHAAIAVSAEVEHSIRGRLDLNGKPVLRTVPNGVDVAHLGELRAEAPSVRAALGIEQGTPVVVNVANFTPKKRHTDLLQAMRVILEQDPEVRLLLVGQGPLLDAVRTEAKQLGVADQTTFLGYRDDAPKVVAAADVFALSSQYEGLPLSVLESMAVGTPVVSTRVGGVPEAIRDGVDGMLVDPLSPQLLADSVMTLLRDPSTRARLAESAQTRVREQFDISVMVRRVESLYDEILGNKRDLVPS